MLPLNDAINAFEHAITDEPREWSILANHHAGHNVPGQVPTGPVGYTEGSVGGVAISNSARGITEMRPLLEGHQIIAGTPRLTFTSTNTAADARVFWGLAVGTSPEDALLIDAQWMPSRVELPSTGEEVSIELGAVAADVEEGQTLYLVASVSPPPPATERFSRPLPVTP